MFCSNHRRWFKADCKDKEKNKKKEKKLGHPAVDTQNFAYLQYRTCTFAIGDIPIIFALANRVPCSTIEPRWGYISQAGVQTPDYSDVPATYTNPVGSIYPQTP